MEEVSKVIEIIDSTVQAVFGTFDENLKLIERELNVSITLHGDALTVRGSEVNTAKAEALLKELSKIAHLGQVVSKDTVRHALDLIHDGTIEEILLLAKDSVAVTARGKQIKCKTVGQRKYVKSITQNTVVFGVGPAGTGKTYLAVAMAVTAYKKGEVEKIILTRPAIEAGEKLGFLPGDLQEKVDPYLRPLYDALQEMFGLDNYTKLIERGIIEIAPLAYMRGRTLSNAFIILDEAQNTTIEQMKMFLTRMGENSRVVINGDDTQIDLPDGKTSGLKHAVKVLEGIEDIGICFLSDKDIVRHALIQKIVLAYEKNQAESDKIKSKSFNNRTSK